MSVRETRCGETSFPGQGTTNCRRDRCQGPRPGTDTGWFPGRMLQPRTAPGCFQKRKPEQGAGVPPVRGRPGDARLGPANAIAEKGFFDVADELAAKVG